MEFSTPQYYSAKNLYRIGLTTTEKLQSEAFYFDPSGELTITEPDVSSFVQVFIKKFIEKDAQAKWFATRLKEASVLKKLTHNFASSDESMPSESGWYIADWVPNTLEIYSTGFQLCWYIRECHPTDAQISSRFLALSEPPSPRSQSPSETHQVTPEVHQVTPGISQVTSEIRQVVIHQSGELESAFEIPFANDNTAMDFEKQEIDKRNLQEARLRLALAKLKSQRLSETYYRKYGEVPEDDLSDLSEDEYTDSP